MESSGERFGKTNEELAREKATRGIRGKLKVLREVRVGRNAVKVKSDREIARKQ